METRIPLGYFSSGDELGDYAQVRELCHSNPLLSWAAYIGGSIFTLLKEEAVSMPYGFSMLLMSAVPMNVGIGSSAAVEIGTLSCLNAYLGLRARPRARWPSSARSPKTMWSARPCGIMDQIAISCGRQGKLTHILCRPGTVQGEVDIPPGTGFVGINSMVRHSVGGNPYSEPGSARSWGKKSSMLSAPKAAGRP